MIKKLLQRTREKIAYYFNSRRNSQGLFCNGDHCGQCEGRHRKATVRLVNGVQVTNAEDAALSKVSGHLSVRLLSSAYLITVSISLAGLDSYPRGADGHQGAFLRVVSLLKHSACGRVPC